MRFEPLIWSAGLRLMSMSAAKRSPTSTTPATTMRRRLNLLCSLHVLAAMTPSMGMVKTFKYALYNHEARAARPLRLRRVGDATHRPGDLCEVHRSWPNGHSRQTPNHHFVHTGSGSASLGCGRLAEARSRRSFAGAKAPGAADGMRPARRLTATAVSIATGFVASAFAEKTVERGSGVVGRP